MSLYNGSVGDYIGTTRGAHTHVWSPIQESIKSHHNIMCGFFCSQDLHMSIKGNVRE